MLLAGGRRRVSVSHLSSLDMERDDGMHMNPEPVEDGNGLLLLYRTAAM